MTEKKTPSTKIDQKQERMWAMFCHLSALINLVVWVPCANILGPLVIWLIKKNDIPLVDKAGKEALNFQLSMTIYIVISFMLMFVGIGFLLIVPLALANLILVIIASVKVNNGEEFQYPITIRFLK